MFSNEVCKINDFLRYSFGHIFEGDGIIIYTCTLTKHYYY